MADQIADNNSPVYTMGFTKLAEKNPWLINIRRSVGEYKITEKKSEGYASAVLLDNMGTVVMSAHQMSEPMAAKITFFMTDKYMLANYVPNMVHIIMKPPDKILPARFYKSQAGNEPVKIWLKDLSKEDRKLVGADIRTVEFGWPIGMPVCRKIVSHKGLWETRSNLTGGRIARVIFYVSNSEMILLNGFEKTSQKTPKSELDLAIKRKKEHEKHG